MNLHQKFIICFYQPLAKFHFRYQFLTYQDFHIQPLRVQFGPPIEPAQTCKLKSPTFSAAFANSISKFPKIWSRMFFLHYNEDLPYFFCVRWSVIKTCCGTYDIYSVPPTLFIRGCNIFHPIIKTLSSIRIKLCH